MKPTSQIEISKSAFVHNLAFIQKIVGKDIQYSSVVKGNAYGHGIEQFVPLAFQCGVRHFSVFSADEAYRVEAATEGEATIMIMGMIDNEQLEWAITNGIEFFVFDMDRLEQAVEVAQKVGKPARVHIEVETGMNRTGFSSRGFQHVLHYLRLANPHLEVKGLCTHYAGAESIANYHRVKRQQRLYNSALKRMKEFGVSPQYRHTACSAASIRYPRTRMDLVRIGILQYGFFPSRETLIYYLTRNKEHDYPLQRLISWKSKVMDVKAVKTGEFIGYGTSFLANNDMKIATVPVGYSHGFSRVLSNQGKVLIHGQRHGVVGTVNMNMMSIDVTHLDNVKKGDEVVIIGKQGDMEISVSSFSEYSDQVNYELLTRLPLNIPRKVVE
jgi:alanine racemase